MKILLVDDDSFLRDMYSTKFTESGDDVSSAKSGEEALQIISKNIFDVVLLDMVMPGLSGIDLIKAINEIESAKDTRCIVLSNQSDPSDIDSAKKNGALGYIIKANLVPSEVVSEVHKLIK